MKHEQALGALVCCAIVAALVGGCGSGGNGTEAGIDPMVQTQATGTITPGAGGTVSTPAFDVQFPPGAVSAPTKVVLQVLRLDPFQRAIPGTGGQLVQVCRLQPENLRLLAGKAATLTYKRNRAFRPGATVSVYRQEVQPKLIGQATLGGLNYSLDIGRLGVYLWVLDSNFCLRFDGFDDHVKFSTTDAFTIECWFRTRETSTDPCDYRQLVSTWGGGAVGKTPYPYELRLWLGSCGANGSVEFAVYDGSETDGFDLAGGDQPAMYVAGPYNDGRWHQLAAVRAGTTLMNVYMDGNLVGSKTPDPSRGPINNQRPVTVGGDVLNWHGFHGDIDEVRIWGAARTQPDIRSTRHKRLTGSETNLRALWNFDEGGGTVAHDATGNGHDGSLVSDPKWVEATWKVVP
jgi:hypothetical protein